MAALKLKKKACSFDPAVVDHHIFLAGLLQIVPLPAAVVRQISPAGYDWRQTLVTSGLVDQAKLRWQTISLSPAESLSELVKYLAFGLFAFLLSRAIDTRKKVRALTLVLIGAGVFNLFTGYRSILAAATGYSPG